VSPAAFKTPLHVLKIFKGKDSGEITGFDGKPTEV
jgi:hypothetical protein